MRFAIVLLAGALLAGCKGTPGTSSLHNSKDTTSYALGANFGKRFKADSLDISPDLFVRGIQDMLQDSSKRLLSDVEVQTVLSQLDQTITMKRMASVAAKNKNEGEKCLEENKKRAGVITLPSGLQYEVLADGKGPMPKANQTVQIRYKGMLVDGTVFDGSDKHGGSVTFPVSGVIPGWTEALLRMKVGSKWRLVIPSDLAYGERGAGGIIGPNATLMFEIELLAIK